MKLGDVYVIEGALRTVGVVIEVAYEGSNYFVGADMWFHHHTGHVSTFNTRSTHDLRDPNLHWMALGEYVEPEPPIPDDSVPIPF